MPMLTNKKGESAWFITSFDGPWQVFSSRKDHDDAPSQSIWGTVNILTGKMFNVGTSAPGSKKNYYDKACEKARELNIKERERHFQQQCSMGYNRQDIRESITSTLNFCITEPGAFCYEGGVPALVRRLEAINEEIKMTLALMRSKDALDWANQGIFSNMAMSVNESIDLRKS